MIKRMVLYHFLKKHIGDSLGFTLIEMLIVLSLMMVLLILPIRQVQKIEDSQKITLFIQLLQNDLFLAQRNAVLKQIPTRIIFYQGKYEIEDNLLNPPIVIRNYDQAISVTYLTLRPPLRYNSDGNISNSGTISVKYKKIEYVVTIYLGSGRFKYDKKS
ncbi:competence type IV pilus minor pilin ComGD [Gottfriedia luciferensis]|uniref:competence type IV pilus minor pilin ComGD n=1 Tax=Gottfriedia luciferensis TaxID=178774 RepID=UPI000B44FB54|nr:competence type IV pilus minor pilin ComGD [Gottfriedia luciferensis]